MKLRKYDVILCKNSKSLISKLIRLSTNDKYSHSELFIGNYHIVDTMFPSGVTIRHLDRKLGDFDVYRYNGVITDKQMEKIDEFIQKQLNGKYDLAELVMQGINQEGGDKNKYICISLIVAAFKYAKIDLGKWRKGFEQVTDNPKFTKIYIDE